MHNKLIKRSASTKKNVIFFFLRDAKYFSTIFFLSLRRPARIHVKSMVLYMKTNRLYVLISLGSS